MTPTQSPSMASQATANSTNPIELPKPFTNTLVGDDWEDVFTTEQVRAAIEADRLRASYASAPDGYVCVPLEPTRAMLKAGADAVNNDGELAIQAAWRYMLAAATPPQALPNAAPVDAVPGEPVAKLVAKLVEALQFYADGCHQVTLTNIPRKHGFDWDTERQKLNDKGFFMAAENSNGSEHFVEDGTVAAEAIAASAPSRAQAEWISVETRLPDSSRRVLACNPLGYVGAAQYAKGHWNGIGGASGWMELPEPLATPGETK